MDKKRIRSILFLLVGIALFWYVYRDMELERLGRHLRTLQWGWIALSLCLNLGSQVVKAIRWRMLIVPLNYSPGLLNLFLSNLVLAFTNLIIPRGGEIARLGVIRQYEGIPVAKQLGTALTERLTDLIFVVLVALTLFIWQGENFRQMIGSEGRIALDPSNAVRNLLIALSLVALLIIAYKVFTGTALNKRMALRLKQLKRDVAEGFRTFKKIPHKWFYLFLSALQFILWLMMTYVIFFAYPPTSHLSLKAAAFTFGLSVLAFLVPVQGGIGAWHYVVIQALLLFGITEAEGKIFALIAHSFTMLINLGTGALAFALLPLVNRDSRDGAEVRGTPGR